MSLNNMKGAADFLDELQNHINNTVGFLVNGRNYQIEQGSTVIKVNENFEEKPFDVEQFYNDWQALELEVFTAFQANKIDL